MTMPYYASPEQLMRDRSEYARKGISRGRSVAVVTYVDGVLFIAENPSSTLHKVGELYDRIGFAAVADTIVEERAAADRENVDRGA